jgi:ABC-type antimicrobial peptide transport system permease subunit
MIQNYIVITLRSLWKNRSHTIINILGLSLGITCSILIFLIIRFELSYDNYHPNGDRIYRIVTKYKVGGNTAGITYPLPVALRQDFPDPEHVIIVDSNLNGPVITIHHADGKADRYKEPNVTFTDPEYFKVFRYEWLEGNENALAGEKTVVITESIARKYFRNESALNKVINFNNEFDVTVSGVVKDPPLNTDFPFRLIFSARLGANKRGWDTWGSQSSSLNCYVQLNPSVSEKEFESKLNGWHLKYFTGENEEDGKERTYVLQPLKDIHFNTSLSNFGGRTISKLTLLTLSFIGIVLLLTACINFINLNTVLIINRSKEAGIRKVMGSTRVQLVTQFLSETLMITLVSLIISTGLVELSILYITPDLGYQLRFDPLSDLQTLAFLFTLPVVVTLLSGLYPGISLSRFQPVKALKNKLTGNPGEGLTLRRTLVVFQLVISQVLIVCTVIAVQQINHFMAQPLGIQSEGVVEFGLPSHKPELIHTLSERLKNIPGVINATMSNTGSTAASQWNGDAELNVNGKLIKVITMVKIADHNYVNTYGLTLLHGEDLIESDTANRFLVNETFSRELGFENTADAIGLPVHLWGRKAVITGIVKDFNTDNLRESLDPTIVLCGTSSFFLGAVSLNTRAVTQVLPEIQKTWESVYPNYVFEYRFLDETIAGFYDAERRNAYLIGIFAAVSIFIGCIGLFGLISFMARSKTKEVGIRKTLGASISQIIALFSKEFVILIILSFVLSSPLAYYFMEQWLENFAYRIHPGISTFLIGVMLTFTVVLGTIGIKSYKAATANPVDALRDE